MKHLTAVIFLSLVAVTATAQTAGQESKPAEQTPPPSRGADVQRQPNGIVVIKSSSAATQAARAKAAKEAEDAKKAEAQKAEDAKKGTGKAAADKAAADKVKAAEAQKAQRPKARAVESYGYDANGQRTGGVTSSEQNSDSSGQSTQTIVGTDGKRVPYVTTQEKVVSKSANRSVVERQVQRYDTQGNPTRQGLVREEERKLADGTVERTTTVYEQDVNGSMKPAERTVSREVSKGNKTHTVVTTERPSASGGFQTVEQKESTETKQGEKSAVVETVVKRPTINGDFSESKRERSVTETSGKSATTEKQVWERSTASGEVSLSERTVGKTVERPDGTSSETIQVYGYARPGGGASDANATNGPRLVQSVQREKSKAANGETVETTTTRDRGVADPSTLGEAKVVQKVSRPTTGGETVETNVSEESVNGKLRPTQATKEQVTKEQVKK